MEKKAKAEEKRARRNQRKQAAEASGEPDSPGTDSQATEIETASADESSPINPVSQDESS
jgi:hypothetical protein